MRIRFLKGYDIINYWSAKIHILFCVIYVFKKLEHFMVYQIGLIYGKKMSRIVNHFTDCLGDEFFGFSQRSSIIEDIVFSHQNQHGDIECSQFFFRKSFFFPRRYCSKKSALIPFELIDNVDMVREIRLSLEYITFIIFFNKAGLGGIHTKVCTGLSKITLFKLPLWCNAKSIASQPPREGPIK